MTGHEPVERGIVLTPRLLWAFGSIAGIIAGSVGPWLTFAAISVSGTGDGRDGTITLVLGIVAAVLVVIERARVLVGVLAGVALAIAVIDGAQVLRSREETFLGSIELGWGLIVLALGAAGLLAWSITEYASETSSRLRAVAFGGIALALVGTTAALAASGRFNEFEDGEEARSSEQVAADPKPAKPKETCDGLGINATKRNEGDCVAENGWQVRVVDDDSRLRLDDVAVRLVDVQVLDELRDLADDAVRPDGRFVRLTLEVENTTNAPIDISSSEFVLASGGTVNEPDTDAFVEDALAWVPQLALRGMARKARFCRQDQVFGGVKACI